MLMNVAAVMLAATVMLVANTHRPMADEALDPVRKPSEILKFAGIKRSDTVGEYMPGGGYFTRLFSEAVGPRGHVYAYPPTEIVKLVPRYLTDAHAVAAAAPHRNVTVRTGPNGEFGAPVPLDVAFTARNYHDLHTRFAPQDAAVHFNAAVFRSLRRGGRYVIIDHRAVAGSGVMAADPLHRIDPVSVRAEVEAAGFRFDGESLVLANPMDPRTASVFDPSIRSRTDQFVLRFRKP